MRHTLLGCLLLMLASPLVQAGKRNPYLMMLERSERLQKARILRDWKPGDESQVDSIPVLVLTLDPAVTAEEVRRLGGYAGKPVGKILPVRASATVLSALAGREEVVRMEASPPRRPVLDLSLADVKADAAHAGIGIPMPVTGEGVIAALVDTGVDYDHADFGETRTRVIQIWDQFSASGEPPEGKDTGALCDRSSLLKETCDSVDLVGHGTHVAATMASSHHTYLGMAPDAAIMAVASIDFGLLVESVAWLFDEGQKMGKPVVINLSLGGHYGPHDGTSLESIALSDLTGPGRIIVAAAGNEGADFIHLGYDPNGTTGKTVFYVFSGFDVSAALFTIWHEAQADLEFAIGVQKNGGEVDESEFVEAAGNASQTTLQDAVTDLGTVYFEPAGDPDPGNGKMQMDIVVEPTDHTYANNPGGYTWYLKVKGSGFFDAWSAASGFLTPPARFSDQDTDGLVPGDNAKTVGMPAVATGVIAVASYATRGDWIDHEGTPVHHEETTPGSISFFSSHGPSADPNRTGHKPLVAAPGEYIVAALSEHSSSLEPGTKIETDHIAMRGTSMACPHVAGIVALLLEVQPTMNPDQARRILSSTARRDDATGSQLPDPVWGHGKVDAFEAVAMALGVGVCQTQDDCAEELECSDLGRCEPAGDVGCSCSTHPACRCLYLLPLGFWFLARKRRGTTC